MMFCAYGKVISPFFSRQTRFVDLSQPLKAAFVKNRKTSKKQVKKQDVGEKRVKKICSFTKKGVPLQPQLSNRGA